MLKIESLMPKHQRYKQITEHGTIIQSEVWKHNAIFDRIKLALESDHCYGMKSKI